MDAAIELTGERALSVLSGPGFATQRGDRLLPRSLAGRPRCARTSGPDARSCWSRWRLTRPDPLLGHAATFRAWRVRLAELYQLGGLAADTAARLATTVIAASEGAVVISRAERSLEPFEQVAARLSAMP